MSIGPATTLNGLPSELRPLFWDHAFESIDVHQHREFVIGRLLTEGHWDAIRWLRRTIGDRAISTWIETTNGRRLTRQQLRFWEQMLDIPHEQVNRWIEARDSVGWENRISK